MVFKKLSISISKQCALCQVEQLLTNSISFHRNTRGRNRSKSIAILILLLWSCWGCSTDISGQSSPLSSDPNFVNYIASTVAFSSDFPLLYSRKSQAPAFLQHKIRAIYYYEVHEDRSSLLRGKFFFDSLGRWKGSEHRPYDTLMNRWDTDEFIYIHNESDKKVREIRRATYNRGVTDTAIWVRCSYNSRGLLSTMDFNTADVEFQYDENDNLLGYKCYTYRSKHHEKGQFPVVLTYKFNPYYLIDTVMMARRYVWGLFTGKEYPVKIAQYDSSGRLVCNVEEDVLVPNTFAYRYANDSVYVCKNTIGCGTPCPDSLASTILKLNDRGLPIYEEDGNNTPYQIIRYRYEYQYW